MGSSTYGVFLSAAACLVASGLASAAAAALVALSDHRARALAEEGGGPRGIGALLRRREAVRLSLLSLDALAKALFGLLVGGAALARRDTPGLAIAIALVGIAAMWVTLAVARGWATRDAEVTLRWAAPVAAAVDVLLRPVSLPLTALARAVRGRAARNDDPTEELEYILEKTAEEGTLDHARREMLENVIEFADVSVREIMVPRPKVVAIEAGASQDEVLRIVRESEHSRLPVYQGSIDNVVGILYAKRLLSQLPGPFRLQSVLNAPYFVPEGMKINVLLREFQRRRSHIAVVVDEFGGTSGVVTLEDVVEEIVGEIQDETDAEDQPVRLVTEGVLLIDGAVSLRDVEGHLAETFSLDESFEFPEEGDYETLAGFVAASVGRVPQLADVVRLGGLAFTVRGLDQNRVAKVEVTRDPSAAPPAEPPAAVAGEELP